MNKSRKKSVVLFAYIFVILGIWMMLSVHCQAAETNNDDDVEKKLANHEIDCFVSLEESIWSEQGISSVTTIGKSGIYFAINKERSDIKTKMDHAMRQLEQDSPFFKADLYKKYFTLDYKQSLTGKEKS